MSLLFLKVLDRGNILCYTAVKHKCFTAVREVFDMDKKIQTAILLDLYRGLLTKKQSEVLDLYCNEDLSLSEIAENTHVTRQAVHDAIAKGEKILFETEEKTGLGKRIKMLEERLSEINLLVQSDGSKTAKRIKELSEIGE